MGNYFILSSPLSNYPHGLYPPNLAPLPLNSMTFDSYFLDLTNLQDVF